MSYQTLTAHRTLPPLAAVVFALGDKVLRWEQRWQTRRALRGLDAHLLRDIGLCPYAAHIEGRKVFWRD